MPIRNIHRTDERDTKLQILRLAAKEGFDEIDQGKGDMLKSKKAIAQFVTDIETEVKAKFAKGVGSITSGKR